MKAARFNLDSFLIKSFGKLPLRVVVGFVVAFAGVALALADPGEPVPAVAVLLVTGAAAAQAFGNVLIKRFGPLQPMRLIAWLSFFTEPQVGVGSALFETGQEAAVWNANVPADETRAPIPRRPPTGEQSSDILIPWN